MDRFYHWDFPRISRWELRQPPQRAKGGWRKLRPPEHAPLEVRREDTTPKRAKKGK